MKRAASHRFVLYTAVLPAYRRHCIEIVDAQLGDDWVAFAGPTHLDSTVRTELPLHLYVPVSNYDLFGGRVLFQWGHWSEAINASTAILDLNPRSFTAWCLLLLRKAFRRRTLLWGHLDPRKGAAAPTARVRAAMRDLADGCVLYTYSSAARLSVATSANNIWVAPNSLYPRRFLEVRADADRDLILFVGRLEPEKKPLLLLEAFAVVAETNPEMRLAYVGEGSLRAELEASVSRRGLCDRIQVLGPIQDAERLASLYRHTRCSVSPGFVGLSLTQSLGFGVPMVIADGEPHSPEVELACGDAAVFFPRDSVRGLAEAMQSPALELTAAQRGALVEDVKNRYSSEAMAQGLVDALYANPQRESNRGNAIYAAS